MTLDYDIFLKIKHQQDLKNKNRMDTTQAIPKDISNKKPEKITGIKRGPAKGQKVRDRIDQYANSKRKFGDTKKFIFRKEPNELNWYQK